MYIDTHIHLDSKEYENDLEAVINNALTAGVKYFINPGSDLRSLEVIPRICEKYPQVLPAYGIHPHDAKEFDGKIYAKIKSLLREKAVAVGETGMDFHYNFSPADIQKEVFIKHIYLAKEFDLPLIIHSRKAEEEIHALLKKEKISKGVVHCYSGSLDYAKRFIDMGFYIGITGVVTFQKSENIREIVKNIPIERLLTETDGPYMAPVPHRGKRNLPEYIPIIAEEISQIATLVLDPPIRKPPSGGCPLSWAFYTNWESRLRGGPKVAIWSKSDSSVQNQLFQNAKDLFGF